MPISAVFNEDNMIGMARYPDKFFDLAIVDPPYGIGNFVQISGNIRGKAVTWNDNIPIQAYFYELRRVSKNTIIWGCNYYNQFDDKGGAIVWYKHVPKASNLSECEIASYSGAKRVDYIDLKWQNINRTEETIHECQKPVGLYKYLLHRYAKPGFKVLDTHMGSQSSRIAAFNMGFDYYGWEIDKEYFDKGNKRFLEQTAQMQIFYHEPILYLFCDILAYQY